MHLKGLSVLQLKSHQKIIHRTTREVLRPAGLIQKGTSRLWYLDCGWYACFAEFQPFKGRQGTTLNFGISWLWYPKEYWTFDIYNRLGEFVEYEEDESFRASVLALSNHVVEYCTQTHAAIRTPEDAYALVENHKKKTDWHAFNLAILAGLAGKTDTSRSLFDLALLPQAKIAWKIELNEVISILKSELSDRQTFKRCIDARIKEARTLLKLPSTQLSYIP